MMKCPYPDCSGQVTAGDEFCGECGRSLAPQAVAAAVAGMTAGGGPPPGIVPTVPTPFIPPPPTAAYPALVQPPPVAAPSNRMPLILGGTVGLVLLLAVACLGGLYVIGTNVPRTPGPVAGSAEVSFQLADLDAGNNFKVARAVQTGAGRALGEVTFGASYNYEKLGAPQLLSTVEVKLDNELVLELAAADDPAFAATNPRYEVAEVGKTYTRTTAKGWTVATTVNAVTSKAHPLLPTGSTGNQAIFTSLAFTVVLQPTP